MSDAGGVVFPQGTGPSPDEPPVRPFIATNCYGGVKPYYVTSLVRVFQEWALRGWELPRYANIEGVYVPEARNDLLRQLRAIGAESGTDGVLWIEQDHRWSPSAVDEVLELAKEWTGCIVGAPYMASGMEKVVVGRPLEGDFQVDARFQLMEHVGFGFTWTPWSVYDAIPQPWFETGFDSGQPPTLLTDDVVFCRKARVAGIPIIGANRAGVEHRFDPGPRAVPFLKARNP